MGGHAADDMRIVRDAGSTGIPGPAVGFGGGAGGEIGLEEGMQTIGRIVGHLLEADATGAGPAILDLDGADYEYLALMAAPAAAGQGIVLAAADDLGFVDLDEPGQGAAVASHHAAPQFGTQQPSRLVGAEAELALQLQGRDAVGMGGHQIGGPEPQGQRQLGVMHDGAGGHRGLLAAIRHLVAWIGGVGALSPTRVPGHAVRTYSGRPRSSIRFSTSAAIATSIACRPSVWERRPSPTTRFHREMSHSTRARQPYPEARCQPMRPRSAIHRRCASRRVGVISAASLGTAFARGGTTTAAAGWRAATAA